MNSFLKRSITISIFSASLTILVACEQKNVSRIETAQPVINEEISIIDKQTIENPAIESEEVVDIVNVVEPEKLQSQLALHERKAQSNRIKREAGGPSSLAEKSMSPHMAFDMAIPSRGIAVGGIRHAREQLDRERYIHFDENPVKLVSEDPVSTFSIDVDTGSYSNVRRMLQEGRLPPDDAVRVEELINYFSYEYASTKDTATPFNVIHEVAVNPWNHENLLLHIGIQAYEPEEKTLPASNLVFLVDVSGSMQSPNKLELLKSSLKLLTRQLEQKDRVSLVVYAGASGVVLQPTPGDQHQKIINAVDALLAGGSTNGSAGIDMAYAMAEQAFIPNGINRVILATDGDFNVGRVNHEQLMDLIEKKKRSGIALSTLGFGTGNYNDALMEQLADKGNGNYAYIDTLNEAQKVLVDEMTSTLLTVAKDVKIQIEFNPQLISEYRLIGYENRMLNREDFNNDKIDAGEIGAGHSITALYEITPVDSNAKLIEPLRYQEQKRVDSVNNELALIKLRYKKPHTENSELMKWVVTQDMIINELEMSSENFRFSAAVAAFAQQLKGGHYLSSFSFNDLIKLIHSSRGEDRFGYRGEFLKLVRLAQSLGLFSHDRLAILE